MEYINSDVVTKFSKIGQGCMGLGGELERDHHNDEQSLAALRYGLDCGLNYIDTAEAYGAGHSEELVGEFAQGIRKDLFIASKVSPENLSSEKLNLSLERSLRRLRTDYIDLYQIHWPNPSSPLEDTIEALLKARSAGKIRNIGICNYDSYDIRRIASLIPDVGLFSVQSEYNLFDRFVEQDVLPAAREVARHFIAYSPLDKGRTTDGDAAVHLINSLSKIYSRTPAQIALNWLVKRRGVLVIPKSINFEHIWANSTALDFELDADHVREIEETCNSKPTLVDVKEIRVSTSGDGGRSVYQTLEEALQNRLNLTPSPIELSKQLLIGNPIKPVRLIKSSEEVTHWNFDLIEGRLRYWGWIIAFGYDKPIPSYVRSKSIL